MAFKKTWSLTNEHNQYLCNKDEGTRLSKFTAEVNMFVDSSEKDNVIEALSKIDAIEEVYDVTGEYDVVSIVSTPCIEEFRELLHEKILRIKGVKSTVVTVVLKLHNKTFFQKDKYLINNQNLIQER